MINITVAKLKKMIENYDDNNVVMCGFEGLTFYKPVGDDKHDYVGRIDFDNEKRRTSKIFSSDFSGYDKEE